MSNKTLFRIAGIIAVVTIFSKIIGFLRDVVTAQAYGATLVSDAYFYAYQIPALALILLGGLGGPFHTATVSFFSKTISDISKSPTYNIQSIFNTFVTVTALSFGLLSILIFLFSDQIIAAIASGAPTELHRLASVQLKIMSPVMLIGGVIGIFYGISNVYKEFFFTSLSPTVVSIVIIGAILIFKHDETGIILAWGTLIGALGQLLLQLPVFWKSGFNFKPELNLSGNSIAKIGEILFPAMLGTTIGQINIYIDMFFASRLESGAWSAVGYANRIFQFPVGIIITALLVPLFPMFSTYVGKKEWKSIKYYFHQGLNSLWFMAFPLFVFMTVFAQDGIRLLFQRGAFDAGDTLLVSEALVYLSISIIPYVARDTLTRVFYAFDDSRTPFFVALFSIIVKTVMNMLLVGPLGIGGITLSTTVVTLINALILGFFIKNKISLEFIKFIKPVSKIALASVLMGFITFFISKAIMILCPNNTVFLAIRLCLTAILGIIAYFIISLALKIDTAYLLIDKIKNKFQKQNLAEIDTP
jgi:putative peptidoglycan lipid II flippase